MLGKEELRRRYRGLSGEEADSTLIQWDQLANAVILLYEKACYKKDQEMDRIREEMKTLKSVVPQKRICCVCFNPCTDPLNCGVCDRPVHKVHGVVSDAESSYGKGIVCDTCRRLERLQLTAIDQISHQLDIKSQLDSIQAIILDLYKIDLETQEDNQSFSHSGSSEEDNDDTIQVGPERNGGIKRKSTIIEEHEVEEREKAVHPPSSKNPKMDNRLSPESPPIQSPVLRIEGYENEDTKPPKPDFPPLDTNELMFKEYVESRPKTKTIKGFAYHTLITKKLLQATCPFCPNKCFRNPKGFEDHLVKKHNGKSLPLHKTLPVELQLCILGDSKGTTATPLIDVN